MLQPSVNKAVSMKATCLIHGAEATVVASISTCHNPVHVTK
jgi:hypothetical protein